MALEVFSNCIMYLSLLSVAAFLVLLARRYFSREPGSSMMTDVNIVPDFFSAVRKIGALFLWNRILLFTVVYLFVSVINNKKLGFLQSFKDIWFKWDSNGYLRIAENWYVTTGDEKFDIALYPMYPLLVKAANYIIHNYFLSGVFVSNLFLFIGLVYLYKLVSMEFNQEDTAFDSTKYLLFFPFSFFFSIVYTESVFFTLTVLTIYFIRRKKWHLGGLFGLFASFTRNQGLLLLIPIFIELVSEIPWKEYLAAGNLRLIFRKLCLVVSVSLLVPCGTALYLLTNKLTYGDWFKFLSFQDENWHQRFGFFAKNIKDFVYFIASPEIRLSLGIFTPNLVIFFLCMALLILTVRKLRLSYLAYTLAYVLVSFSPTWLLSGPRYIAGMFTMYVMLALAIRKASSKKLAEGIFCVLLIFYAVLFTLNGVY